MKQLALKTLAVLAISLPFVLGAPASQAANLADKDKQFLSAYEKTHAALAADDLNGAKASAPALGDAGADLAKSTSLRDARVAFERLSARAKQLAAGQSDYHVFHCPMLKKDWVQTSTTVSNPYGGKEMVGCGEIQK
ncbi:MAG: DUF3347 domain-containing protein [Chthoniobacterales bacterium]|nr:DUF3347 domain-containing protein [Chthoniobacterales bacterium]